jgi:hypothetical protein
MSSKLPSKTSLPRRQLLTGGRRAPQLGSLGFIGGERVDFNRELRQEREYEAPRRLQCSAKSLERGAVVSMCSMTLSEINVSR